MAIRRGDYRQTGLHLAQWTNILQCPSTDLTPHMCWSTFSGTDMNLGREQSMNMSKWRMLSGKDPYFRHCSSAQDEAALGVDMMSRPKSILYSPNGEM
jgi:hypothetical protein